MIFFSSLILYVMQPVIIPNDGKYNRHFCTNLDNERENAYLLFNEQRLQNERSSPPQLWYICTLIYPCSEFLYIYVHIYHHILYV